MAEDLFPSAPNRNLPLSRGDDLLFKVVRRSDGQPALWDDGISATLTIGESSWDFEAVDGVIVVRVESDELDDVSKKTKWSLTINYPTDPVYNNVIVNGVVVRSDG